MATTGDGRGPYERGGAGDKFRKRPFPSEINEEPQNVSQEAGRNNSTRVSELSSHPGGNPANISATIGKSELKQVLKQMTFTSSETQCLIAVLQSRTIDESSSETDEAKPPLPTAPSPLLRLEASTSGSLKKHKLGDERDNFHASIVSSRVLEKHIASSDELAKAYKGSTTGQGLRQYVNLVNNNATGIPKTPMASPRHPTTMENLPDELLINIFIRLLAKQLAQMRSVSKSWNALLSQSSFIKSHLHHSIHNNDSIILVFYDVNTLHPEPFTTHRCRSLYPKLTNFIKLPAVDPQYEYNKITVIGSINGLICSYYSDSVIHILNPSLSTVLTLPPYAMPFHAHKSFKIYFQFGFDSKTDDYKLVKLTGFTGPHKIYVKWWLQVEIYSMRKDTWELITERFPSHITRISDDDVLCVDGHDGHLHWFGYTDKDYVSERIVSFDLGSETFREIPLPDYRSVGCRYNVLGVLAGELCLMSTVMDKGCEVWMMNEYGVAESWIKCYDFSRLGCVFIPHGFTLHNELLFQDYEDHFLCNPFVNEEEYFHIIGCRESHEANKMVNYIDSLVWVAPAKREMADGAQQS